MKLLPWLLLAGLLAYGIPKSCANDARWKDWRADTLRLLSDVNLLRSQSLIKDRENDSLRRVVSRNSTQSVRASRFARGAKAESDSLRGLLQTLPPDTSQAHEVALRAIEALGVAYDSLNLAYGLLEGAFRDQQRAYGNLERLSGTQSVVIDSLVSLIRRTPGCPKLPFGLSVPRIGVGVGVGLKGPGVMVGVVVPLSCR